MLCACGGGQSLVPACCAPCQVVRAVLWREVRGEEELRFGRKGNDGEASTHIFRGEKLPGVNLGYFFPVVQGVTMEPCALFVPARRCDRTAVVLVLVFFLSLFFSRALFLTAFPSISTDSFDLDGLC